MEIRSESSKLSNTIRIDIRLKGLKVFQKIEKKTAECVSVWFDYFERFDFCSPNIGYNNIIFVFKLYTRFNHLVSLSMAAWTITFKLVRT